MWSPKKRKYKKDRKGKIKVNLKAKSNMELNEGECGLKVLEGGYISSRQLEAGRKVIMRETKRLGKVWIRIYPDVPVTSKSIGARMGRGKGEVDYWCARIRQGMVIYEISGGGIEKQKKALMRAGKKLSLETRIIVRNTGY